MMSKAEKLYTYNVLVSFQMQYTFREDEVEHAEEGDERDLDPTGEAIANLEEELTEYLGQNYAVEKVDAFADFLLGVVESPVTREPPRASPLGASLKKASKKRKKKW